MSCSFIKVTEKEVKSKKCTLYLNVDFERIFFVLANLESFAQLQTNSYKSRTFLGEFEGRVNV